MDGLRVDDDDDDYGHSQPSRRPSQASLRQPASPRSVAPRAPWEERRLPALEIDTDLDVRFGPPPAARQYAARRPPPAMRRGSGASAASSVSFENGPASPVSPGMRPLAPVRPLRSGSDSRPPTRGSGAQIPPMSDLRLRQMAANRPPPLTVPRPSSPSARSPPASAPYSQQHFATGPTANVRQPPASAGLPPLGFGRSNPPRAGRLDPDRRPSVDSTTPHRNYRSDSSTTNSSVASGLSMSNDASTPLTDGHLTDDDDACTTASADGITAEVRFGFDGLLSQLQETLQAPPTAKPALANPPAAGPVERLPNGAAPSRKRVHTCRGCHNKIIGKSISSADGRLSGRWHKACFTCHTCARPFESADFYIFEDRPYCSQHYHVLNNSLCMGCHLGIEGECLETETSRRYHRQCFCCDRCSEHLSEDYYEINHVPLCEKHALEEHRRLQKAAGTTSKLEKRRTRVMTMLM
ncbi:uncharacterized protein V1510DRAFT_419444 [Dipodascopsis tothii]|uniref:uncharacterized protein n=1 Tax=Dipodascopsis tothii TaxID=44089 RepID=UPI0034CD6566